MVLSEGYIPSRLDSYLSEDGILQNLTWNDTRSRVQVNQFLWRVLIHTICKGSYFSFLQVVPRTVWYWDDATWILAASFIIFTMQTGFGMLESGIVSLKNQESTSIRVLKKSSC